VNDETRYNSCFCRLGKISDASPPDLTTWCEVRKDWLGAGRPSGNGKRDHDVKRTRGEEDKCSRQGKLVSHVVSSSLPVT
jgi:hypothetical protein